MSDETGASATGSGPDVVARLLRHRLAGGQELWLSVDGRSMWPTIQPPARVRLVAAERPRCAEVWAYVDAGGAIVVHRCERRAGPGHVFKGDGLPGADPWVPMGSVIGRVADVEDQRGRRPLGTGDRLVGMGLLAQSRLRSVGRRSRKWVRGLIARRGDRR
jgi:hypothetical protein